MNKHILHKFIVLSVFAAIFTGSALFLPQTGQAGDADIVAPGRFLGSGQHAGDGFESSLDGPPGALSAGRSTGNARNDNAKPRGIIKGEGFSLNLTNPKTHGHEEDVGARAGWSWEF
jgi:hypothetical protein